MRTYLYITILLIVSLFLSECKKDKGLADLGGYPNDVGKIMVLKCATSGCHNNASYQAAAGLNLSTWESMFAGSNAGSPVIPFRSDFSSLCYFINTYSDLGNINTPTMPYNADILSREEVKLIKDWIDAGAPDINGNIKWADNPNRKKVYVINQGCDVVTVFDQETQLPIRYINVGRDAVNTENPHMIKVSPDGQYWYVVFLNSSYMQKYRCSDDVFMGEVNLNNALDWNTFVITDDGKKAFCVSWALSGRIASVDLDKMKLIADVFPIRYPHGVALNETNDTLYVTGQQSNYILKVDTSLQSLPSQTITLDGMPVLDANSLNPHEILISPDKKNFYITCYGSAELRVFNIASQSTATIIPVGQSPVEMSVAPNKRKLYITCMNDITSFPGFRGSVSEIDIDLFTERRMQVGEAPHGLAVDESKGVVYIASRNTSSSGPAPHHSSVCGGRNGFISYIDINTFTLKSKRTEISVDPYGVAIRK